MSFTRIFLSLCVISEGSLIVKSVFNKNSVSIYHASDFAILKLVALLKSLFDHKVVLIMNNKTIFTKSKFLVVYIASALLMLVTNRCTNREAPPPPPPPPTANSAPVVNAGRDTIIFIPKNSVTLTATVSDDQGIQDVKDYRWKKISGPGSIFINQQKAKAEFIWLEEGIYDFEFTATDEKGLSAKDTVTVTLTTQLRKYVVTNLRPNLWYTEIQIPDSVFKDLKWAFCKSSHYCEQSDAGPSSNIDYSWGGWYYILSNNNKMVVYGGYSNEDFDLIVYY